jgi:hypothetical protein
MQPIDNDPQLSAQSRALLDYLQLVEQRAELHEVFRRVLLSAIEPALVLRRKDEELKRQQELLRQLDQDDEVPRLPRPDPIDWSDGVGAWVGAEIRRLQHLGLVPSDRDLISEQPY